MAEFEHMNTKPPEEQVVKDNSQVAPPAEVTPPASGTPPAETTAPPETKPDEFIETFNKRYGTAYKSDEEIKPIFETPKRVTELTEKYKDYDDHKRNADKYKAELEELRDKGYSEFLTKPRIKAAFVAQQLIEKYPDKDADTLQQIVMSDISKMDNLDVVAREMKIRLPEESIDDLKKSILAELNIDGDTPPKEWDSVARIRLAEKAQTARSIIKTLTDSVEIPKFPTKEEREQAQANALTEREKLVAPIKDKFVGFDKYTNGDFEFGVPPEFKEKTSDIFKGIFVDAGLEINEQNLAVAEAMKRGLFLEEYLPKILEAKEAQVRTALQQKVDVELDNTELPNTATATDNPATEQGLPGLGKFFEDAKTGTRATKL